jgi:phenylpropionate dioxygenase-like ring-hydroxylating dioxygenase large terminal subunit
MMAPKNCWYVAAFSKDVGRELVSRTILGQPVVMFRTTDGRAVALADRCPHRAVPLSLGTLIDNTIRCTYHGMQIGADGACTRIPCQDMIPSKARAATFPVAERHTFVWVWMGDAALADAAAIPDFHWMDDPEWTTCAGYHHIEANYQLLNDNLLDLSHESYVHDDTIGNDAVAEAPVNVKIKDGKVVVHRDIPDCEPPPFYVKATGFTTRINRWHTTFFQPPSFLVIENGSYPATGAKDEALERRILNLITPETETSSHYFWGIARAYQRDDAELTAYIQKQIYYTFDQDKVVLEAQQRNLGLDASSPFPIALRTDAGPIQARKLLKQVIDNELVRPLA